MKPHTKQQPLGKLVLILALLAGLFSVVPVQSVHAVDLPVVNTNDNGAGSLRQAIADATAGDTITFDSSLAGQTITLESDLLIDKNLTIDGSGLSPQVTVNGGNVAHWVINSSTVSITALTIANGHTTGNGGGILANGNLTLINSTIRNSIADGDGGGLYNSGDLIIQNTTVNQNQANRGGGISYQGIGSVSILNTTITGNQAARGGGVYISGIPSFIMTNVTIADNPTAVLDYGFFSSAPGVQLINTIIATEDGVTYAVPLNMVNSVLCAWCSAGGMGLAPLTDNGGSTQTMALLPGSSLIDAGDDSLCPVTDQRGTIRPKGAHCDIGAFEYQLDKIVTNTNDSGPGSLRQTLVDSSDGDTIRFDPSLAGQTIFLATELEVDKSLTITSMDLMPHVTISGDTDDNGTGDVQLMTITPLSTVSIYGIDFVNGKNSPGTNSGGINNLGSLAIYSSFFSNNVGDQGGAIRNSGILTVEDTIFNDNSAFEGGAILNNPNAQAEIRNSAFNWNSADAGEGGAGAIANLGTISIIDSNFVQNTAYNGGAIFNSFGGTTTISNSRFTGNSASEYGGAVYNFEGTTTITQSTFSTNTANYGGAIGIGKFGELYPATTNISESNIINNQASYLAGGILFESGTSTSIDKVTISGNIAPSAGGILNASSKLLSITNSAIYNNVATLSSDPGGIMSLLSPLIITNSTITGNSGAGVGAQGDTVISNSTIAGNAGYGLEFFDFTLTITNTILANNGGLDCQNQYGTVAVNDFNLIETNSNCGTPMLTDDPNLGPLANNSGITQTLPLLPGSPAINAGDDATCETTDQRGVARPEGAHCDIGAYEYHYSDIYYVKSLASGAGDCLSWINACTLEDALISAIGGDEIWVAAGTHKPTMGTDRHATFQLKEDVAVYGGFAGTETARSQRAPTVNLAVLSGDLNGDDVGFTNNGENVYHVVTGANNSILDGFTITAGNAVIVDAGPACGGGMYNKYDNTTLTNIIFSGNTARCGGGMYSDPHSNPTLTNVSFNGNSGMWGGGMFNDHQSNPILVNVIFSGNSATESGGGMSNHSSNVALTNVTFIGNSAGYSGGGLDNHFSSLVLTNVTFSNNSAGYYGGGVGNEYDSNSQIRNTIFWGNSAPASAQIYNNDSSVDMHDSVVQGGCPAGTTCTNIITTTPMLGVLGNYGGVTLTIPLLASSSAIDTGNDATCSTADQRGIARPQGAHCDIGAFEFVDSAPTDIALSNNTIAENQPVALVGNLSTTDPDISDSFTYSFCGGLDDISFHITGATLQTNAAFDYEEKSNYSVCIRSADIAGLYTDKTFPIAITNVNEMPTDIALSNNNILENQPLGTIIGNLSAADPDAGDTHTYSFCGGTDDGLFQIIGNALQAAAIFDFETKSSYEICLRADDGNSGTFDKDFTISVTDVPGLELIVPVNGESLRGTRPVFDWSNYTGAVGYQIQVSKSTGFGTTLVNVTLTGATNSQYTPTKDLPANTYLYWRVRGKLSATKYSSWSAVFSFTTANPPSVPALTAPANGALVAGPAPLFDWTDSTVPAGKTFDYYQIQIATDNAFATILHDNNITGINNSQDNTAILPAGATYYWRVRALTTAGDTSAWSVMRSVKIMFTSPPLLGPPDLSVVGGLMPTFTWDAVTGAPGYTIQISKTISFGIGKINANVVSPTYTPGANLAAHTKYYWRVRVSGAYASGWSLVFSFTTP